MRDRSSVQIVGRRVGPFDRAGAACGARRSELHRRRADVSFRHEAFDRFPGVELLRAVAAEIRLPAFAIGGISKENVGQVISSRIRASRHQRGDTGAEIRSMPRRNTKCLDNRNMIDRNIGVRRACAIFLSTIFLSLIWMWER